jgi:hypothetical protein
MWHSLHMDDRVWHGQWWIPGDEANAQPGTLVLSPDGTNHLDLIGGFDTSLRTPVEGGGWTVSPADKAVAVLFGSDGSDEVTLVDCFATYTEGAFSGTPSFQTIQAARILVGAHIADPSGAHFREGYVRLENLLGWSTLSGMTYSIGFDSTTSARIEPPAPLTAKIEGWDVELSVRQRQFHYERIRNAVSVIGRTDGVLRLSAESAVSYSSFDELTKAFMDLLTLASNEPCGVIAMELVLAEQERRRTGPGDDEFQMMDRSVEVYGRRVHVAHPDFPPQENHRFLFTCATLPFEELVPNWYALWSKARPACDVLFGLHYARPGFTENRLLLTAVAAEALHRDLYGDVTDLTPEAFADLRGRLLGGLSDEAEKQWVKAALRNSPSYRARLHALAGVPDPAAVRAFLPDVEQWASDLVQARNGLAHNSGRNQGAVDLFDLTETSIFLLYLVMMSEIGISAEAQQAAVNANERLSQIRASRPVGDMPELEPKNLE